MQHEVTETQAGGPRPFVLLEKQNPPCFLLHKNTKSLFLTPGKVLMLWKYVGVATLPSRTPGPPLDPSQVFLLSLPAWICCFFNGGRLQGPPLLFHKAADVPYQLNQDWAAFGSQRLIVSTIASFVPT